MTSRQTRTAKPNAVTEALISTNVKEAFVVESVFSVMEEYENEIYDFKELLKSIASSS